MKKIEKKSKKNIKIEKKRKTHKNNGNETKMVYKKII